MSGEQRAFDPVRFLTKVNGRDYLEVKWRLAWLRSEHPEAKVQTELVTADSVSAVFRALVEIPEGGSATGWGSESASDFPDFLEKAETKALGRALAALGYGTQFCQDFDFGADQQRVVDSPIDVRGTRAPFFGGRQEATPRQLNYLRRVAREAGLDDEDLERRAMDTFGETVAQLDRRNVSSLIELIQSERVDGPPASGGSPEARPGPSSESASNGASGMAGKDPTERQVGKVWSLAEELHWSSAQVNGYANETWGQPVGNLDRDQMSQFINYLMTSPEPWVDPRQQRMEIESPPREVRVIDGESYDVETGERIEAETPEDVMARIIARAGDVTLSGGEWKALKAEAEAHGVLSDEIVAGALAAAHEAIRARQAARKTVEADRPGK